MATLTQLTPTQSTIIRAAAIRPDGEISIPDTLRGSARAKTLQGLLTRGWIVAVGDGHQLTDAGYATIGHTRPVPKPLQSSDAIQNLDPIAQPCRAGTKLAKLVASLQNPEGATIFQLMSSTGWQRHTIRGAISGMLRKKYGLKIEMADSANGDRVYRIV
ncbi:MAG: DUF3489 domain-containing protein [Rhodoferax sp.]|nr:DUF3489 domain-containing protein [Rhodoferax sp.]